MALRFVEATSTRASPSCTSAGMVTNGLTALMLVDAAARKTTVGAGGSPTVICWVTLWVRPPGSVTVSFTS